MKKKALITAITIELVIIAATLALVLPYVPVHGGTFSGTKVLSEADQDTFLAFDLIPGQKVSGYYIPPSMEYRFHDIAGPNSTSLAGQDVYYNGNNGRAIFSFTADIPGSYYLRISGVLGYFSYDISYSYTVSEPRVFGLNTMAWISTVIFVGAVLTLINFALYLYSGRRKTNQYSLNNTGAP
jgi:hypothetical protein